MFQLRLIGRLGLGLLLAFAALVASVQAYRLMLLPALVAQFQPGEALTSALRRVGILGFALLAYWAYVRLYEKRKADELRPPKPRALVLGLLAGAGLLGLAALSLYAFGVYEVVEYRGLHGGLFGAAGLILVAGMLEEVAYRGLIFRTLEKGWGTLAALCLQSLLFGIGHLENLGESASTAEQVTMIASVTPIGAWWTLVYVHSRNLWVAGANHAAWNFTILLTGLPLSGLEDWIALAPLASESHGPALLTGGRFGPETSVVTMLLVSTGVVALWRRASTSGKLVQAQSAIPVAAEAAA